MNDSWITRSHQELLELRGRSPGWGNRRAGSAYVEPTCLAALALAASRPASGAEKSQAAVRDAADWLARLQQRDGALGIAPDLPQPRWTTALGVLVWSATGAADAARRKAVEWLLSRQGNTWTPEVAEPFGHDPRIAGWPWVEGTHSWLEPTALAVLALSRAGRKEHEPTSGPTPRPPDWRCWPWRKPTSRIARLSPPVALTSNASCRRRVRRSRSASESWHSPPGDAGLLQRTTGWWRRTTGRPAARIRLPNWPVCSWPPGLALWNSWG
jgi:hypothetical protein